MIVLVNDKETLASVSDEAMSPQQTDENVITQIFCQL